MYIISITCETLHKQYFPLPVYMNWLIVTPLKYIYIDSCRMSQIYIMCISHVRCMYMQCEAMYTYIGYTLLVSWNKIHLHEANEQVVMQGLSCISHLFWVKIQVSIIF